MSDQSDTDDSNEPDHTIEVNGKRYTLNGDVRSAVQKRAEHEYSDNWMFSCFWKQAFPEQYTDEEWEENIHDTGDSVLVIETEGPMVPWERLDTLNVEMQEVGPDSQLDNMAQGSSQSDQNDDVKSGNGMKMVPNDGNDDEDAQMQIGRTHFGITPQQFEEVPGPDGEEEDKIPAKPEQLGDDPSLVWWVPNHPDIDHSWGAGEAITPVHSRVEWNVQKKADQPSVDGEKDDSHDHWESILKSHDCDVVAELAPNQDVGSDQQNDTAGQVQRKGKKQFEDGKYGGNNWQV